MPLKNNLKVVPPYLAVEILSYNLCRKWHISFSYFILIHYIYIYYMQFYVNIKYVSLWLFWLLLLLSIALTSAFTDNVPAPCFPVPSSEHLCAPVFLWRALSLLPPHGLFTFWFLPPEKQEINVEKRQPQSLFHATYIKLNSEYILTLSMRVKTCNFLE